MSYKSNDERPNVEEETSLLLDDRPNVSKSDYEETPDDPSEEPLFRRIFNRYFFLEAFTVINYIGGILNILFIALLYLHLYTPKPFDEFQHRCAPKVEMSVFLDLVLSVATVVLFSYILRYLRQVF